MKQALAGGPLFDDDAEVVELLDDGFDVAANAGAILEACLGRLGDGDDAAIAPGSGRQRDEGFDQVTGTDDDFLAAGSLRTEHGSLAHRAGIGIRHDDAKIESVYVHGDKRIEPGTGLMDIDVKALGGQGDSGKSVTLLVTLCRLGLSLLFNCDGCFGNTGDCLLFLVAGCEATTQQRQSGNSNHSRARSHPSRITGAARAMDPRRGAGVRGVAGDFDRENSQVVPLMPMEFRVVRLQQAQSRVPGSIARLSARWIAVLVLPMMLGTAERASARQASNLVPATVVETAEYTPCGDRCSAVADPARAFCLRTGGQTLVGEGRSYFHETRLSDMDDLGGKQLQIHFNNRWIWMRTSGGDEIKIRRGSEYEEFKDPRCVAEVNKPILALANRHKRPARVPGSAIAIAGPEQGDDPQRFLWYACTMDTGAATIACHRWYRDGGSYGDDWYCARTLSGKPVGVDFRIDPLQSDAGHLVLTSGGVLERDTRGRINGRLERPDEACY